MIKMIRWSGLIGFVVVVALLAAFFVFAFGPLTKMAIEKFGSDAVGAKVEVASIDLGFSPLSLNINGVQVADRDKPMENIISFDKASANIEVFPLLLGKAIMPMVELEGVELGSARETSGALPKKKKEAPKEESKPEAKQAVASKDESKETESSSASKALPSADEILAREQLLTEQTGKALQEAYDQHKADIDSAIANLPDDAALKSYETRLNGILKGKFKSLDDFKNRKKELDALKAQFKKDKAAIKTASSAVKNGKSDLKQKVAALKAAPKQDLNNIKGKYTMDAAGASNLAALLFGDEAGGYADTALGYYEKVRPLLVDEEAKENKAEAKAKRLEGEFVHFETDRPMPDFWIQQLSFTMALPKFKGNVALGSVVVSVKDITHQQDVIGRPTVLVANGENLKDIASLTINGVMDHRASIANGKGIDQFDLTINDWAISNLDLGLAGLKLVSSNTQVIANIAFSDGELNGTGQGTFEQSQFNSKDRTVFAKEMVAALKNVTSFKVNTKAKGEITSPSVSINSDLDRQLQAAFDKRIKQKQKELEAKLKKKLNEKLLSYAGDYEQQLKEFNLAEGKLSDKGKALEKLAKSELSSYQDQLKAEAKAKAKAKADAKKAKAKADADKKRKELEKKAKEKLKKLF